MPEQTEITPTVTLETLEGTPARALTFLRAVGTRPRIYAVLQRRGYGAADHAEGWSLLHAASGQLPESIAPAVPLSNSRVAAAIAELDETDETMINILSASLGRRFPSIAERVLDGIDADRGPRAVLSIATILERLQALDAEEDADSQAALELVGERGYPRAERERLSELVAIAQGVPDVAPVDPATADEAEHRYVQALARLRAWYEEWSSIARTVITRRDHLIRLGLASRRSRSASDASADPTNDVEELNEDTGAV